MTGSGAAFGQMLDETTEASEQQVVTQVTTPIQMIGVGKTVQIDTAPISGSVVTTEDALSGPVQVNRLTEGPVVSAPVHNEGSVGWLSAKQKEQNKLKTIAELKQSELEAEIARLQKIASDTKTLNETLVLVKNQIGKTPWVFSGSTPSAWDCSGLVMWTYAHLGVELQHSATKQRLSGEFVTKPKIGDLVSFNFRSYGSAYHIGIYVGPDEMLHAGGKPGDRTEIRSISGWQKDNGNSEVTYTRLIETNN